jgi:hypothetical protein
LHLIRQGVHVVADEARVAAWLRGEDLHGTPPEGAVKGDILILVDAQNRLLGRARVQAERLKKPAAAPGDAVIQKLWHKYGVFLSIGTLTGCNLNKDNYN